MSLFLVLQEQQWYLWVCWPLLSGVRSGLKMWIFIILTICSIIWDYWCFPVSEVRARDVTFLCVICTYSMMNSNQLPQTSTTHIVIDTLLDFLISCFTLALVWPCKVCVKADYIGATRPPAASKTWDAIWWRNSVKPEQFKYFVFGGKILHTACFI